MDKYDIGGFAIWEKNDDGEAVIRYLDDNIKRLTVRNLDILNVIIDFSIKYDTFITAKEIADTLKANGKLDHDRDTVKHALIRIRKQNEWGRIIVSSPTGYMIKCEPVSSIPQQSLSREELNVSISDPDDFDVMDPLSIPVPVPKGEAPIIDNSPVLFAYPGYETYLHNFIKDKQKIRTYFYGDSPHDVLDVMQPMILLGKGSESFLDVSFNALFNDNERHRYIVSAPVGGGKSILARKIAVEAAVNNSRLGVLPILYDLSTFSDTDKSLFDILEDEYESYIPGDDTDPFSAFTACCQSGDALLIFDSLDDMNPKLRDSFVRKLNTFLRSFGNNTIIIFSRPTDSFTDFESFKELEIEPLRGDMPLNMIHDLIHILDEDDKRALDTFVLDMQKLPFYNSTLYGNPLFLSLICVENKYGCSRDSLNKHTYIERLIRYAVGEDPFFKHKRYSNCHLTSKELNDELCRLCLYLVINDIRCFDTDTINDCWKHFSIDSNLDAHDILDDFCRGYGLVCFKEGKYEFVDDLVVAYYYAKMLIRRNFITAAYDYVQYHSVFSPESILEMMYEMKSTAVSREIYCKYIELNFETNNDSDYIEYLCKYFPTIEYYVGKDDYTIHNYRRDGIYSSIVRDWEIAEDIDNLPLPPLAKFERSAVLFVSPEISKEIGIRAGLIEDYMCDSSVCDEYDLQPVGYIYHIDMKKVFEADDEDSLALKEILMSEEFPLRREFENVFNVSLSYESK